MKKKPQSSNSTDLKEVKEHYEDYPYPYRNPEDEKTRLLVLAGEYLGELNHWLFKGKENFKSKFRVLIAGGGTGDALVYAAHQLSNTNAEIVYIDFSKASMEIAQKRAEARGLKNIKWIHDSILNIPNLNLGKFDFINCSGVLHHLESPPAGLKALKSVLSERGGMNLMVYAKYGRTGVYQVQELMRKINVGVTHRTEEIMNTKSILNILPNSNWFKLGGGLFTDIEAFGDIGIYDLLLHKQDRCYSIPEMHEFIEEEGLNFVDFSTTDTRVSLKPENYIKDFSLLQKVKGLERKEQHAICELIKGSIIKHSFYVSNTKDSIATLEDINNVPYFYSISANANLEISNLIEVNKVVVGASISLNLNNSWVQNLPIIFVVTPFTQAIFKNIDGKRSLKEIFDLIRKESKNPTIANEQLIIEAKSCLSPLIEAGVVVLRDKSIDFFATN